MANKKSRSIEEQIELLKQRGMIVGDEIFAARHLAHISYYRLKGYWWDMQYDKTHHLFQPDSNLEDVVTRYYFDKELRLILFDAIETIEITLRTKMIYHLSQSYGGLWYRDPELFADAAFHAQHLKELTVNCRDGWKPFHTCATSSRTIPEYGAGIWSNALVISAIREWHGFPAR